MLEDGKLIDMDIADTTTEYVRNRVLVVIGKPNICCIQKLYN
ncbi:hypothetical protein [Phocaeicola vulgatus]|nr:hypothetical protein [Phocaeicola vulgatus]MCS2730106.1 hypothetical protein [Phocaeicola vulgatus]